MDSIKNFFSTYWLAIYDWGKSMVQVIRLFGIGISVLFTVYTQLTGKDILWLGDKAWAIIAYFTLLFSSVWVYCKAFNKYISQDSLEVELNPLRVEVNDFQNREYRYNQFNSIANLKLSGVINIVNHIEKPLVVIPEWKSMTINWKPTEPDSILQVSDIQFKIKNPHGTGKIVKTLELSPASSGSFEFFISIPVKLIEGNDSISPLLPVTLNLQFNARGCSPILKCIEFDSKRVNETIEEHIYQLEKKSSEIKAEFQKLSGSLEGFQEPRKLLENFHKKQSETIAEEYLLK